jgi:glycosyltransferase involved in cell wall biosynthesis
MKVLFLSRWYPYPPNNGSKIRIFNLIRGLSKKHEVSLISFIDPTEPPVEMDELRSLCSDIQVVPRKPFTPGSWRARLGLFSPLPRSVVDTFSAEMKHCIEHTLSIGDIQAVIASEVDMVAYAPYFGGTPALLDDLEVGALYESFALARSPGRRLRSGLTWGKHRRYLARLLHRFGACTVVSERERRLLAELVPGYRNIELIPNCINLDDYLLVRKEIRPNTIIFTGSFDYQPNYEAMLWFLAEVFPRIQAVIPEATLTITGNHGGRSLPSAKNVELTGFVEAVSPLIASAAVSLAPIHHGGGTRLKILEAMALRTPVVSTSKGAEGLDVCDGEHLLIANTPEAFAQAVVRLLEEPDLGQQLAENAYHLVREAYDWKVVMPRLLNILDGLKAN